MFATEAEINQYARLTLKQYGFSHLKIEWAAETTKSYLGLADVNKNSIKLNKRILSNFALFRLVLLHEIAHFEQYKRNGNKFFRKNGRWQFHGADFKAVCRDFKIPASSRIPIAIFN
jgi:predicted SprT family Zn-dependent metalloprotease